MKNLFVAACLIMILSPQVQAQNNPGRFCFNYQIPTTTVDGGPVSAVGLSMLYFEIARFDTNGQETYRGSVEITDFSTPVHCFDDVPTGPNLHFANQAYDALSCAGEVSEITIHDVFEDRAMLSPATVTVIITGTQPSTPTNIIP